MKCVVHKQWKWSALFTNSDIGVRCSQTVIWRCAVYKQWYETRCSRTLIMKCAIYKQWYETRCSQTVIWSALFTNSDNEVRFLQTVKEVRCSQNSDNVVRYLQTVIMKRAVYKQWLCSALFTNSDCSALSRKLKGGMPCGGHLAVTYGEELLYLRSGFFRS